MARSYVVIYKPILDFYLNDPQGEVGRYLKRRGDLIVSAARRQVGKRTGFLAGSIHLRQSRIFNGQKMEIGSNLNYALYHHEGTKPHTIVAKRAKTLRFHSGGRVIYTRAVNHPGTKANRYLKDNLYIILT